MDDLSTMMQLAVDLQCISSEYMDSPALRSIDAHLNEIMGTLDEIVVDEITHSRSAK